jgi:tRNA (guanine37-N1)-methyltransferase
MRSRAVVVPRARGEAIRRALSDAGLLRDDLAIGHEGDDLVFPVREGRLSPEWGVESVREFASIVRARPAQYSDLLDWPAARKALLPRSFDVVGDVVLLRLPAELVADGPAIGAALLGFVPGARIVGLDRGVHGPERRRSIERLAGAGGFRTRHRENGVDLEVDVERAYFSPRLSREHALVADQVRDGDSVYDLCCGVGPFAVTIAKAGRARQVTAVDSNPEAISLLGASLTRGRFSVPVRPVAASVEAFLPAAAPVERVILNLPLEGAKYLTPVARTVAPEGRLYYYEVVPRDAIPARVNHVERTLDPVGGWTVVDQHLVHPYSPTADLVALVLERTG